MVVHGYLVRVPSVQRFEEARYSLIEQDIADARASGRPRQQFPSAEEMQALCLLRNATEAASRAAGSGGFIGVFSLQDGLKVAEVLSMLDQLEARQRFGVPRGFGNLEIRVLPLPHGLVQSAEYPDAWCSPRT